ncbi:DUF4870 domain-containing protein [Flavisolibacter tropicus]|uniref:tRNA modification GTPase n=1 Tax=Flavisolibacter tropicus TaxID=1492898 RepID=A0A172U0P0_9BACT|nr:DUF4870 domain-containing protein [Flavisolibacter tropicus]ANE52557.1 hypothetical protein SY85_20820 [Flavisolibacter tropicus]
MDRSYLGHSENTIQPVSDNERMLGVLSHALTLIASFVAPLIIYILKKDESMFVREHAKESLNFQLTLMLAYFIGFILIFVVIGIILLPLIGIVQLVLVVIATINAADNKLYRYPFCIRFIN